MKKISAFFLTVCLLIMASFVYAQDIPVSKVEHGSSLHPNAILVMCVGFLAVVILVLANVLKASMDYYTDKNKKAAISATKVGKSILLIIAGTLSFSIVSAQGINENVIATPAAITQSDFFKWILIAAITIEIIIIFFFAKWIKFFTGVEEFEKEKRRAKKPAKLISLHKIWERMNKLKPIEQEADIDTGHSYDGIRELDNVTPPWFKVGFILSIVFAIGYLWRYHVAQSAPLQIEEYQIELAEAKLKQEEYLKAQANAVDETTVQMLDQPGIDAGSTVYKANCVACHGDKGQGGVGPNLTDDYWIHGGGIQEIFKSIKYGWQEKGMKAWKDDFSPTQIAQLTSYIKSLKGTNPPGAKEQEGVLYTEVIANAADSATAKTDSTKTAMK